MNRKIARKKYAGTLYAKIAKIRFDMFLLQDKHEKFANNIKDLQEQNI